MSVIQYYGALIVAASLFPLSMKAFSLLIPKARGWGLVDRPGGRHMHAMPVAVVGGLAIMISWFAGIAALFAVSHDWKLAHAGELGVLSACAAAVLALGIADDRKGISPKLRLLVEVAIGAITVAFVPSAHDFCQELSASFGVTVYPLTVVGIVGVMNAMNLVDGMDGLAGTMFLLIAASIVALSVPYGLNPPVGGVTALLLIPGLMSFLRKNWAPAVTFMGDHGSLCIGYLLVTAAMGIRVRGPVHGPADILMMASLFSYPVLDMLICVARRILLAQPVARGDRNHLHHRMLRLGLSPRESVIGLVAWHAAMLVPVFMIRLLPLAWTPLVLVASLSVALERLLLLGRIEGARVRQYRLRLLGLFRPRGIPPVASSFVRARVRMPLRPLIEAAQFEERGCLQEMIQALRFFCDRRVKGHGFVQVTESELIVSLVGSPAGAPTPEELKREWTEALKGFSQVYRLTFSTWSLPVMISTPSAALAEEESEDAVEAA